MGIRERRALAVFLVLCTLVFLYSASAAGDTGKQPEGSIAIISLVVILLTVMGLVISWIRKGLRRRFLRSRKDYMSRKPMPEAPSSPPKLRLKDFSLPVREEDLWPEGELLHLQGIPYFGATAGIIASLTEKELLVASPEIADDELSPDETEEGYGVWTGNLQYTLSYPTADITRVRISHWGVSTQLGVWIRWKSGREKKILEMKFVEDFPRTLIALAKKAVEQGLAREGWGLGDERKIFDKELERQFKRAAPGASVVIKGRSISDEDFARLVR